MADLEQLLTEMCAIIKAVNHEAIKSLLERELANESALKMYLSIGPKKSQDEVAEEAEVSQSTVSRSLARWVSLGLVSESAEEKEKYKRLFDPAAYDITLKSLQEKRNKR